MWLIFKVSCTCEQSKAFKEQFSKKSWKKLKAKEEDELGKRNEPVHNAYDITQALIATTGLWTRVLDCGPVRRTGLIN